MANDTQRRRNMDPIAIKVIKLEEKVTSPKQGQGMADVEKETRACVPIYEANTQQTEGDTTNEHQPSLKYGVNEHPPIVLSLVLAFQNLMLSFGSNILISFTVADLACADRNDPIRAKLFCTSVFVVGLTTTLQSAFGIRLPLFQGVSGAFLGPLLSMKTAGIWTCDITVDTGDNSNMTTIANSTRTDQDMVYNRVTQLQGSLMLSGLVTEVLLGGTGLLGYIVRFVGPITVCVTIASLGLSMYPISILYGSSYVPVALCGILIMVLCIAYLQNVNVPIPSIDCRRKKLDLTGRDKPEKFPLFQTFPIFVTVVVTWALCGILTAAGVFPDNPQDPAYRARTDTRGDLISMSPWLFFPYPGQFGPIRFNTAIFIGFLSSYLSSNIESIGDYMMISRATGTYPPPRHAVNRGILMEGVLGVLAGALGAGHATTSYSDNVVIVKLTQVASRSVLILAGVLCMVFGIIGKVGAVMASVPDPVIGGVTVVSMGLLVSIGLSSLRHVNLSSTRNLAVLGTSLYVGLVTSEWLKLNQDKINTGNSSVDQVIKVVLGTQMFVAGVTSVILDNTVKGTKRERGMEEMATFESRTGNQLQKHRHVYDVPGVSWVQKKVPCFRYIPFLQPYRSEDSNDNEKEVN